MCGITGIYAFKDSGTQFFKKLDAAVKKLNNRGPDGNGTFFKDRVALGHARLAIIDTSSAGNQPFTDNSGRYTLVFNGEFYNFKKYRKELSQNGITFKSNSDTEVLLNLYIEKGTDCLQYINGFFALAIYDHHEQSLFIARDRFGIKPLYFYQDSEKLIFGSELKAIFAYDIPKEIDNVSLAQYLHLNYIPGPYSILNKVKKLIPGTFLMIKENEVLTHQYYTIPDADHINHQITYTEAQKKLYDLLDSSVKLRMISDVPLGAFLSGGIDSSIIACLAAQYTDKLNTFSIGYKDEPFFDETQYAQLVAKKINSNHTVFKLSNDDLFEHLNTVLDYIDEPFADSSALAVNLLSMHTRKHVTVALSGDGADEMFAGYNKHAAEYKIRNGGIATSIVKLLWPLFTRFPQSRNSPISNLFRQLVRFGSGASLSPKDRYWRWAGFSTNGNPENQLLNEVNTGHFNTRKEDLTKCLTQGKGLNDVLCTDMNLVLQNDMLVKVDMMSMKNSLEVRVPFLDHNLVNFAFSLPSHFKINGKSRKRILKDTFINQLPSEIFNRGKHGFEVPLLKWFRTELKSKITDDLLEDNYIKEQQIFDPNTIKLIKKQLFSSNPGDVHAQIWALIVFQYWWKKYF